MKLVIKGFHCSDEANWVQSVCRMTMVEVATCACATGGDGARPVVAVVDGLGRLQDTLRMLPRE